MTRNTLRLILVSGWLTLLSPSLVYAAAYALLIGIQDYSKVPNINSLKGPRNDIALMSQTLQDVLQIPKDNITILLDNAATHTGIQKAFQALSEKVQENDFVYIHYSGHGSLTPDGNGDENSIYDQTWVSYNARTGSEGIDDYDILDDEIDDWLQQIKTERVVMVLDSCHSGTATKGAIIRQIPPDARTHQLANEHDDSVWANLKGIRIGATEDDRNAYEDIFPGSDKHYGTFTWFWADALENHRQSNWKTVFSIASQRTRTKKYSQSPHLDERSDKSLLYKWINDDYPALSRGFFPIWVKSVDEQGVVELSAGAASGLTKGSEYWLFGDHSQEPKPFLELTDVWAYKSEGRIIQGPFQKDDLVIEKQRAYDKSKSLMVIGSQETKTYKAVVKKVSQLSGYILTANPNQADLKIHISATDLQVTDGNDQLTQPLLRIPLADQEKAFELLRHNLAIYARADFVKKLSSFYDHDRSNAPQLSFRLLSLDRENNCQEIKNPCSFADLKKVLLPEGENTLYLKHPRTSEIFQLSPHFTSQVTAQVGDKVALRLDNNQGVRDYYCYLVMVEPDGRVNTVELGKAIAQSQVLAGKPIISLSSAGQEVWKFIITTEPIDIEPFQQKGFQKMVSEFLPSSPPNQYRASYQWYVRTYQVHVSDR